MYTEFLPAEDSVRAGGAGGTRGGLDGDQQREQHVVPFCRLNRIRAGHEPGD